MNQLVFNKFSSDILNIALRFGILFKYIYEKVSAHQILTVTIQKHIFVSLMYKGRASEE